MLPLMFSFKQLLYISFIQGSYLWLSYLLPSSYKNKNQYLNFKIVIAIYLLIKQILKSSWQLIACI